MSAAVSAEWRWRFHCTTRASTRSTFYESASAIKELGVGINVLPHATRELTELGLLDELFAVAIPTEELAYYTKRGERIWSEPRGLRAGYRWPQFSIHRGELLGILSRAVVERLGAERLHTGHHLTAFGQTGGRVWAEFQDRATGTPRGRRESDLLVGCDGIHSVVRRALHPHEGPPKWNGITMWRGVTIDKPYLTGRTMIMAGHFARRMVVYPISKQQEDHGRALINWVAEFKTADDQPMPQQDWEHTAQADEATEPFSSYVFDFLDVPAMIRAAEIIYRYPMVDRDPLDTWNFGRVTLLGDAAHPMYPVGSNGASQAILDARVLTRELAVQPSIESAIEAYDRIRRPATAAIVLANRGVGPERCMELVETRAPNGFESLDAVITQDELLEIARQYKATAGFSVEDLNNRASFSSASKVDRPRHAHDQPASTSPARQLLRNGCRRGRALQLLLPLHGGSRGGAVASGRLQHPSAVRRPRLATHQRHLRLPSPAPIRGGIRDRDPHRGDHETDDSLRLRSDRRGDDCCHGIDDRRVREPAV